MNNKKIIGFIIIIVLGLTNTFGQEISSKKLIEKIDSISKAKGIENGVINMHRIASTTSGAYTETYNIQRKPQKFYFDGPFLVMDNGFYNIDKLLYFFIRENYIDFYFQEY